MAHKSRLRLRFKIFLTLSLGLNYMKPKNYETLEHTADIRIRVRAKTIKGLFKIAALAMFDIIAREKSKKSPSKMIKIKQKAQDQKELFVNWLNELLSISYSKELIFSNFKIAKLDETNLEAIVQGCAASDYKIGAEIKAATYCDLKLEKNKAGWIGEVIFDV